MMVEGVQLFEAEVELLVGEAQYCSFTFTKYPPLLEL